MEGLQTVLKLFSRAVIEYYVGNVITYIHITSVTSIYTEHDG